MSITIYPISFIFGMIADYVIQTVIIEAKRVGGFKNLFGM